jgi:hypothetical protein
VQVFLKAHGTGEHPLPERWLEDERGPRRLRRTGFPRRPRMVPGDRLILYASGWRVIFGISEVASEPLRPADAPQRWPWAVDLEPLVVVPSLADAPPVEAIGVPPRSMSQHSHIRLEARHLDLAAEALAATARAPES